MARILDVGRSEIRQDRLQRWDEMDITLWEIGVFTLAEEANCVFTLLFVTL